MPDITITFEDGKQHKYENAPDTLKPEDVYARVQKDFPDAKVKGIARGEVPQKQPTIGFATNRADPRQRYGDPRLFGEAAKGIVAGTIGAVPDVLNVPGELESLAKSGAKFAGANVSTQPSYHVPYGSEEVGKKLFGEAKTPSQKAARALGEFLGPSTFIKGAKLLGEGVSYLGKLPYVIETARGKEAGKAAEELRGVTKSLTQAEIAEQSQIASEAQSRLKSIEQAQQQIANRDAIAAERAARQSGATPEAMADIKQTVFDRLGQRVDDAKKAAKDANLNATETLAHLDDVENRVVRAEKMVQDFENALISDPNKMRPEEFGKMLSEATAKLTEQGLENREKLSGVGKAISSAGNKPIVSTSNINTYINNMMKRIKDPAIRSVLETIQGELTTVYGNKPYQALSVYQTDSLKKSLDRVLRTKQIQLKNGATGDASDAAHYVGQIKDRLLKSANSAWPAYGEAQNKFKELSRPLDIVQRKGPLKAASEIDFLSQDLLRGSAEIAGAVIRRAKEGHPVFTRLLEINPDIKNGARAFYNRELFGGGRVPTIDSLNNFLKTNEGPLRQLGLYDEFTTIAGARESAQKALNAVKAEFSEAKALGKAATSAERQAQKEITAEMALRGTAGERALGATGIAIPKTAIESESAKRAAEASRRLAAAEKAPTAAKSAAETRVENLKTALSDLKNVQDPSKVAGEARKIINDLRDKGSLAINEYDLLNSNISMVEQKFADKKEARDQIIKLVGGLLGTGALAYGGKSAVSGMLGD